jgi:hypothetical protein
VFLAHLRSIARLGGKQGGAVRRQRNAERWDREAADMTKGQIARAFYKRGYNNAAKRIERIAFAKGYEQAVRDMDARPLSAPDEITAVLG